MKRCIMIFIILATTLMSANRFDNMDIVFINGIQNDLEMDAMPSAKELSKAIQQPVDRVKYVYNSTNGFFEDIAETYAYAKMDGTNGGKDFTRFWQFERNII